MSVYLSTSRPFRLFATMSNRNSFPFNSLQRIRVQGCLGTARLTHGQRDGHPAMSALTIFASSGVTSTDGSLTRSSNIISDASSCFHFLPGLVRRGIINARLHVGEHDTDHSQCFWDEHRVPDMTPGPMSKIVA